MKTPLYYKKRLSPKPFGDGGRETGAYANGLCRRYRRQKPGHMRSPGASGAPTPKNASLPGGGHRKKSGKAAPAAYCQANARTSDGLAAKVLFQMGDPLPCSIYSIADKYKDKIIFVARRLRAIETAAKNRQAKNRGAHFA
jgi:hypothetical protein